MGKTIKVSDSVYEKLLDIKNMHNFKSFNDVIEWLLKVTEGRKEVTSRGDQKVTLVTEGDLGRIIEMLEEIRDVIYDIRKYLSGY